MNSDILDDLDSHFWISKSLFPNMFSYYCWTSQRFQQKNYTL